MSYEQWRADAREHAEDVAGKVRGKLDVALRCAEGLDYIPYTVRDGRWQPGPFDGICWWTNGFWPGLMWAAHRLTGEKRYAAEAARAEAMLDDAFRDFEHLHHDVGFMWLISSGAHYRMTGDDMSRRRTLLAADLLAARYNPAGFIRAWNGDNAGWAIIDCMMNLNLLYWASAETGDPRFRNIAMAHADTAMSCFIRPDGSSDHIVIFDPETGAPLDRPAGQGYAPGSMWTRGQAWALYGFGLSFAHTGKEAYLDTAKRVADRFIAELGGDPVPPCDFRQPADAGLKDACAGAIAACGLMELSRLTGERRYFDAGLGLHRALAERCADWSDASPAMLTHCTEAYHSGGHHIAMVYADFFFVEALLKLMGDGFSFWGVE